MPHAGCLSQTFLAFLCPPGSDGTHLQIGAAGEGGVRWGRAPHRVLAPAVETSPETGLFEGVILCRPRPALPVSEEDSDVSKNFFSRDSSVQGGIWAVAHRTDDEQPAPGVSAITPPGRILIRLWNGEL